VRILVHLALQAIGLILTIPAKLRALLDFMPTLQPKFAHHALQNVQLAQAPHFAVLAMLLSSSILTTPVKPPVQKIITKIVLPIIAQTVMPVALHALTTHTAYLVTMVIGSHLITLVKTPVLHQDIIQIILQTLVTHAQ